MFTRSRNGQILVGGVVITVITIAILVLLLLYNGISQNYHSKQVEQKIDFQQGKVQQTSAITAALNDRMWRAEESGSEVQDYDNRTAYKILSYYFTTKGGGSSSIYVNGSRYSKQSVRKDLEKYLRHRMNLIWQTRRNPVGYRVRVIDLENPLSKPVSVGTFSPTPSSLRTSFPVTLANGETVRFVIWTANAKDSTVVTQ